MKKNYIYQFGIFLTTLVLSSHVLAVDEQIISVDDATQPNTTISDIFRSKPDIDKHHSYKRKKIKVKEAKICNARVYCITQKDVGPDGYCPIRKPGIYRFKEDITWCPKKSGTPTEPVSAFRIETENVLLDLDGFTLKQKGDASYTVGVFITNNKSFTDTTTPPLKNIIVRNGRITNIATTAMLVNKADELLLENLNLVNNGYSGYILCPCTAHRAGGIVYSSFVGVTPFLKNHIWRNVHADSNVSSTNEVYIQGADISVVDQVSIENCTFNSNACTSPISGSCAGIEPVSNTNIQFINCQASGNVNMAPIGPTYGFIRPY